MFTGIITDIGTIRSVEQRGDLRLTIGCGFAMEGVAIGASIACSGACLTVVSKTADSFTVDISAESIACTAPDLWRVGGKVNLERALKVGDELGGHIVTGHVDGIGTVLGVCAEGDSHRIGFEVPPALAPLIAPKGSITIDGVSLTVNDVKDAIGADGTTVTHFSVNIIPHTWNVTTLGTLAAGRKVNLEIDTLARYLARMQAYAGSTR
ncbi:riboflavin synthase [Sphingobium sufflavum]|uniref:riboflavin synthase n=1 Tax=Sphingobium sufflavum TaxID=1129547 RepID=UPI001F41B22F|nr:riboflavin synthase [Sphingobium sufflavum]MCE7794940.1 riboflavin synthase [Sphingobium sufflavum]